ncbi:MAG TPA: YlbF family regulator [Candidatus Binatia bacterium]|nr:YlbF family regulator [Candidatus Binatia bacterium]
MTTTQDSVQQKTRELCQAIIEQAEFKDMRRQIEAFLSDDGAKTQYQSVMEKGELLQHKQNMGTPMSNDEIMEFEKERDALVSNPVARGFLDARQQMQKVQESVGQYVAMTFELGRLPTEEDMGGGNCGSGCGCHH